MVKIKPGEEGYAQPLGLTKERGEKAKKHVYREIIDLVRQVVVWNVVYISIDWNID